MLNAMFHGALMFLLAAGVSPADTASTRGFLPTLAIREACAKLDSYDVLRIEGAFGTFVGRATSITPEGFSGLQPVLLKRTPSIREGDSAVPAVASRAIALPDPLGWSLVRSVERRTSPAAKGAIRGAAIASALVLGVAAYAYIEEGPMPDGPSLQVFTAILALPVIALGGILGGILGAEGSPWQPVYPPR